MSNLGVYGFGAILVLGASSSAVAVNLTGAGTRLDTTRVTTAQGTSGGAGSFKVLETVGGQTTLRPACGRDGFLPCDQVVPQLKETIFAQVKLHLDKAYEGKLVDPIKANAYIPTALLQTPICNVKDAVYGTGGETSENHLGQSCGSVCEFACSKAAGGQEGVSCQLKDAKTGCARERAWSRGALVQAAWASLDEVARELADSAGGNRLKLGARCQSLVADPETASVFAAVQAEIDTYLKVNQGRQIACKASEGSGVDQAGCYLSSTRAALENVFTAAATCEAFARATDAYQRDSVALKLLPEGIAKEARTRCKGESADAAKFEKCLNTDYGSTIQKEFAERTFDGGNALADIVRKPAAVQGATSKATTGTTTDTTSAADRARARAAARGSKRDQ